MSKNFLFKGFVSLMLALMFSLVAFSQASEKVSGKILGENNQPLSGVSVTVKGAAIGTASDNNGDYTINLPKANSILVFTIVGYQSKEIAVAGKSEVNVTMQIANNALNEVVVVGFGTQTRKELTTSISTLDNNVLKNVPYTNAASALQGTIAGLRVQSNSGQPGDEPRIILRGGTSINNPNGATPLYVVDGVLRDNMNNINPSDIKSVQVLKDAASTAIYGARGSNGVIIIETKTGKPGKAEISYRSDLTISKVGKLYDLLDATDFLYYARTGIKNTAGLNPAYLTLLTGNTYAGGIGNDLTNNTYLSEQYLTPANQHKLNEGWLSMPDPLDSSKTIIYSNTNYQDFLFRNARFYNNALSISGGSDKATYHLGLGYLDAEGIAIQTNYKRASIDFAGTIKVFDNLSFYSSVKYSSTKNRQVPNITNLFKNSLIQPPTDKLYLEDGTLSPGRNFTFSNAAYAMSTYLPNNHASDLTLVAGAHWKIIKGLTFDPQISLFQRSVYNRSFQKAYWNGTTTYSTSRDAYADYSLASSPQASAVLSYVKSINNVHNIEAKVGLSYFGRDNTALSGSGNKAATDLIPTLNGSAVPVAVYGAETHQVIMGYFSRITYNYMGKYLLNASIRYDGASNLGANNKWGAFPGISAGWVLDKENFWKDIFSKDQLQLKLRASYGVNGNISGLGTYQAQGQYSTSAIYGGNSAIQLSVLPNQDLKWEESKTFDIGMDVGVLKNRVRIMADYYRRVTENLLTTLSMPPSSGFSSILTNYGSLENKGFELEVEASLFPRNSAFQWDVSYNTGIVKSKILKLPPNNIENNRVGGVYVYDAASKKYMWKGGLQEGGRIGDMYAYQQVSIFSTNKEASEGPLDMLIPRANKTKYGGDVNWLDVDKNDTIDTRDRVYMGNPYPTQTGGFSSLFTYKNLSLNVRMDYTLGATIYYETGARLFGNFSGSNALSTEVLRSWKKEGDITDIPKYYWADQNGQWNVWNNRGNSRYYQKADFLCLREVTLAYSLPASILNRLKLTDLRFHITGNNLHYFTKFDGLSPEETATDVAYPNSKNFIIGASITF